MAALVVWGGQVSSTDPPVPTPQRNNSTDLDARKQRATQLQASTADLLARLQSRLEDLRHASIPGADHLVSECERALREIRHHVRYAAR